MDDKLREILEKQMSKIAVIYDGKWMLSKRSIKIRVDKSVVQIKSAVCEELGKEKVSKEMFVVQHDKLEDDIKIHNRALDKAIKTIKG